MIDPLSIILTWAALAAAGWALVLVAADRPLLLDKPASGLLALLLVLIELGLLVQAAVGLVNLAGADHAVDGWSFAGYLLGAVVLLPLAVFWSLAERSRWGMAVVVVGALLVPVLILRLERIWTAAPHALGS